MAPVNAPAPRRNATPGVKAEVAFPLLATVRLRDGLAAEGIAMPPKASGTIVEVLAAGSAYVVEFDEPRHAVMTVHRQLLELTPR